MKTAGISWAFIIIAAFGFSCCPPKPQPTLPCVIAVREHQLRFDALLPILPDQKTSLLKFLVAGGDRHVMGEDAVIPNAKELYGPLLDLLALPENLRVGKLSTGPFSSWFSGNPSYQIIDSRDEDIPPAGSVLAFNNGAFWWVFHQKDSLLTQIIVMKAMPANK